LTEEKSTSVSSSSLKIEWPSTYGKGLHAKANTGKGTVTVNGYSVGSMTTNYGTCSPPGDFYGHPCSTWSVEYSVAASYLSSSPSICITTTNNAIWDVSKITLTVNTQDPAPTCSSTTSCTQTYVTGSSTYYCRDMGSGYKWYSTSEILAKCDSNSDRGNEISCYGGQYLCPDTLSWKWCGSGTDGSDCLLIPVNGVNHVCRDYGTGYQWYTFSQESNYCDSVSELGKTAICGIGQWICSDGYVWKGCAKVNYSWITTYVNKVLHKCYMQSSTAYRWA
jgi:hypothetical protein